MKRFFKINEKRIIELGKNDLMYYADLIDLDMHKSISTISNNNKSFLISEIMGLNWFEYNKENIINFTMFMKYVLELN